jgi:hypothetical protein
MIILTYSRLKKIYDDRTGLINNTTHENGLVKRRTT